MILMLIKQEKIKFDGIEFIIELNGQQVGHTYLYLMRNRLHTQPFGFIENVYAKENYRGQGLGKGLVEEMIKEARRLGYYKIILTARYTKLKIQEFYEQLGFKDRGREFRMDL